MSRTESVKRDNGGETYADNVSKVTGVLVHPCFIETSPTDIKGEEACGGSYLIGFPAGSRVTIIKEDLPGFELQKDCDRVNECLEVFPDLRTLFRRGKV